MSRRAVAVCCLLLLVLSAGACTDSSSGREVVAEFPEAVALYEQSSVKLMGVTVGTVEEIDVHDEFVRVRMVVDEDVPLVADVGAAIQQLGLIGERTVVLFPPWQPGRDRVEGDLTIPAERTRTPVEPDEVLDAFADLAGALDPEQIERFVSSAADAVDGRGARFNQTLEQVGALTSTLADEDDELLAAAENLRDLAATVNRREERLDDLLSSTAAAMDVLASERESIRELLRGLVELTDEGAALVAAHEQHLPEDLTVLARTALVLQRNVESLDLFIDTLPGVARAAPDSYRPDVDALAVRGSGGPSFDALIWSILAPVGITPEDCAELAGGDCPLELPIP